MQFKVGFDWQIDAKNSNLNIFFSFSLYVYKEK